MSQSHTGNTSVGVAADEYAETILSTYERKSPLFAAALVGLPREMVVALISLGFTEGSIFGSTRLAERLTYKTTDETRAGDKS